MVVANILDKYFFVRTAWVIGLNGMNLVKNMLNVGCLFDSVRVVNDQIGASTIHLIRYGMVIGKYGEN